MKVGLQYIGVFLIIIPQMGYTGYIGITVSVCLVCCLSICSVKKFSSHAVAAWIDQTYRCNI